MTALVNAFLREQRKSILAGRAAWRASRPGRDVVCRRSRYGVFAWVQHAEPNTPYPSTNPYHTATEAMAQAVTIANCILDAERTARRHHK